MGKDWTAQFQGEQLHSAAQHGDITKIEQLLQAKYPINGFDDLGKTPLHYAVEEGHMEAADYLIKAGANVNAHDERVIGNTPLRESIKTCSYEMAKLLIDAGADPTISGWMQMNATHSAELRKDANARKIQKLLQSVVKNRYLEAKNARKLLKDKK